jgi:hypothetical protein
MQLTLDGERVITNPSDDEIAQALHAARFAVITAGPDSDNYMQFKHSRKRGFDFEYQRDSLESHFYAVDSGLTLERIVTAFQKYCKGDDSWKTDFDWQLMQVMTHNGVKTLLPYGWPLPKDKSIHRQS